MAENIGKELTIRDKRKKIEALKELRSLGLSPDEIIQQVADNYSLEISTAEYLLGEASREMEAFTGRSKFEHLCESVQWYYTIIQDKDGVYPGAVKERARRQLDKILGLDDHSRPGGPAVFVNMGEMSFGKPADDDIKQIERILEGEVLDD